MRRHPRGLRAGVARAHDNWLRHVQDVSERHQALLEVPAADAGINRLCELNVVEQVRNVCQTTIVQEARNHAAPRDGLSATCTARSPDLRRICTPRAWPTPRWPTRPRRGDDESGSNAGKFDVPPMGRIS